MKHLIVLMMSIFVLISVSSCKKGDMGPAGSAGAQGPAGPQGPIGITGNANVTQYNFAGNDFATTSNLILQITTTADTINRSVLYAYLVRQNGLVYPMPGYGVGGLSDYRMYWSFSSKANIFINKVSGAGDEYASIRVLRLYANNVLSAGRLLNPQPEIDFRDYYAVCKYYNLPY
ncbi:MAG: hypothetical protein ABIR18_06190 [Chitinophagaceae bacterium]